MLIPRDICLKTPLSSLLKRMLDTGQLRAHLYSYRHVNVVTVLSMREAGLKL